MDSNNTIVETGAAPALHLFMGRVEVWAGSPAGRAVVRELRLGIPSIETLTARLRAEFGTLGGAQRYHVRVACAQLGVPLQDSDRISWGPRKVTWEEARIAWQIVIGGTMLCSDCGGGRPIPSVEGALPLASFCDAMCAQMLAAPRARADFNTVVSAEGGCEAQAFLARQLDVGG